MILTRAEAQSEILEVAGPGLALPFVAVSLTPDGDGTIAGLNSALRAGFAAVGLAPAGRTVTDADLAAVPDDKIDTLVKAAQLFALDLVLLRWVAPNESEGASSQQWGSLLESYRKAADRLRAELAGVRVDGIGLTTLGAVTVGLGVLEVCHAEEW